MLKYKIAFFPFELQTQIKYSNFAVPLPRHGNTFQFPFI